MRTDLVDLERTIEQGLVSYREVGGALKTIRDRRLYKADFGTWDHYCRRRWRISGVHGHRLIAASQITQRMLPMGNNSIPTVATERAARELIRAPAALRRRIAEQLAARPSSATAVEIRLAVDALAGQSTEQKFAAATAAEDQARAGLAAIEREQTYGRIVRLCGRLKELPDTLPAAAAADQALNEYLRVVRGQPAARAAA